MLRILRLPLTFCLVFALSASAFADTIRLKDGSLIKGRIITFGGGKFTVVVGEGTPRQRQMTFDANEIESIQFETLAAKISEPTAQKGQNPEKKDPQFIETSSQKTDIPRVVTTDTSASKKLPSNRVPQVMEPAKNGSTKPVEVLVKVLADDTANGWTNSGWVVRKGQKIRIIGDGKISLGSGRSTGPSGLYDVEDSTKLLKSVPTGALIAVIGDDNNEFIYVGSERTFTASRDGALFLGVNEGNLSDNSGSFEVRIEVEPA